MKIISRYLLRELIIYFGISVIAFTGLLLTLRMIRFAALIVNRGVEIDQILMVFLSIVPTFLEIALPLATLLGVMLAFARLSGDSELIVLRASGISLYQFLLPLTIFALAVTAISIQISLVLRPWGFRTLSETLFDIARSRSTSGLDEGIFNKLGDLVLYTEKIDYGTGGLSQVLVDDRRSPESRKIVISQSGQITSDAANRTITLALRDGVIHEQIEGNYLLTEFSTNSLVIGADELFAKDQGDPAARELSTGELAQKVEIFRAAWKAGAESDAAKALGFSPEDLAKKYRRHKTELGQRYSMPMASFIMAFVGMALGILPPRAQKAWGAGLSTALGLGVFVIYYGVLSLGLAMVESGKLKLWIALWLPNIVCGAAAWWCVRQLASERAQSIADVLGKPFAVFRRGRVA